MVADISKSLVLKLVPFHLKQLIIYWSGSYSKVPSGQMDGPMWDQFDNLRFVSSFPTINRCE